MPRRLTRDEQLEFLAGAHVGVISIAHTHPDRGPLAVPIWYHFDPDEGVSVITERASRKGQAIEQAGRFSLVAQREDMPYRYVSVEGPVVASRPASGPDDLEPLARRYLGTEAGTAYASGFPDVDPSTYRYTMMPTVWYSYTESD